MNRWVAIGFGALDLRGQFAGFDGVEIVVLPVHPGQPLGLSGPVAELWLSLVQGAFIPDELDDQEAYLLSEFARAGIASPDVDHPNRLRKLGSPWLSSPLHELVYALVASVAREQGLDLLFIKGPALHRQGLREREHSGDIDVWIAPDQLRQFAEVMRLWGWEMQPGVWNGTPVNHSETYVPRHWGCEIDAHRHFPGAGASEIDQFETMLKESVQMIFGGVELQVPSPSAHAVLQALHMLRPSIGGGAVPPRFAEAAELLRSGGDSTLRIACELNAETALAPSLREAFPGFVDPKRPAPLNWRWRQQSTPTRAYLLAIRMIPIRGRLRALLRVVWPSRDVVIASDLLAGNDAHCLLCARLRRIIRARKHADEWRFWHLFSPRA